MPNRDRVLPPKLRWLKENDNDRYLLACSKGGKNSAARKKEQKLSALERKRYENECWEIFDSFQRERKLNNSI